MAKIRYYLDTRRANAAGEYPVKMQVNHLGDTCLISMGFSIAAKQWDKKTCQVINHPNKAFYNTFLASRKLQADRALLNLAEKGAARRFNSKELTLHLKEIFAPHSANLDKIIMPFFRAYLLNIKTEGTKAVYTTTYNHLQRFCDAEGIDAESLRFEDVTKSMLTRFDNFLALTAPKRNARLINLRNLRAIFNAAIDDEITSHYPFRRFDMSPEETRKRNLTAGRLRQLFAYAEDKRQHVRRHVLLAKLTFLLIGINFKDLCELTTANVVGGRIEYKRAKTKRLYSVKIEPEALEIIQELKGEEHLLCVLDSNADHRYLLKHVNQTLQRLGTGVANYKPVPSDAPFTDVTTYWMRHSWATIAHELDIPKDIISLALGHATGSVTDVYIQYDRRKVDAANRQVIDWVLYGQKKSAEAE